MGKIGEKLKKIRIEKRLSQKQVAEICGITPAAYTFIENGTTKNITIEIGKGIAKALNVSFNELFEIEPNSNEIENFLNEIHNLNQIIEDSSRQIEKLLKEKKEITDIYLLDFVHYTTVEIYRYFEKLNSAQENEIEEILYDAVYKLNFKKEQLIKDINAGFFTVTDYNRAINEFNRFYCIYPAKFPERRIPAYDVYNLIEIADLNEIFKDYLKSPVKE